MFCINIHPIPRGIACILFIKTQHIERVVSIIECPVMKYHLNVRHIKQPCVLLDNLNMMVLRLGSFILGIILH